MQLRSDKDYILTDESKLLIQKNNGKITTIEEIKEIDQRFLYAVGDFTCQLLFSLKLFSIISISFPLMIP